MVAGSSPAGGTTPLLTCEYVLDSDPVLTRIPLMENKILVLQSHTALSI